MSAFVSQINYFFLLFYNFFSSFSCNDGYWAPNRVFDCFCSSSDPDNCSWSAAKKIKEMKCQAALCPDLQTDETKGWSCSGRAKYDLCWAPCQVGLMVKGQGSLKHTTFGSLWKIPGKLCDILNVSTFYIHQRVDFPYFLLI